MAGISRTPQTTAPGTPATPAAGRGKTQTLETTTDGKPRFQGCSGIKAYEVLDKLGEGTFGEVFKGRHKTEGSLFAMKKILTHNEKDGFPITALREIRLLKLLSHPNVLVLKEMVVEHAVRAGKPKSIMYMIMPYMSHDLSGLLENPTVKITEPIIKCYMLQLLKGVKYLHDQRILHRDMKAANLLINNHGLLQIADFGLARQYDEEPPKPGAGGGVANRDYTALVVTRWYRPPELLLGLRKYTTAIDLWGVGCVFGEMFKHKPILAGGTDLKQAEMIFELVGSPTEQNMPGWGELPGCEGVKNFAFRRGKLEEAFRQYSTKPEFLDLMKQFLTLDWRKRITAVDALEHPYFRVSPLPIQPYQIPQFEESHELDRRKFRENAALPPAPAGGTVGIGGHAQGEWGANPPGDWQNGHGGRRHGGPPPNARGHHNNGYGDRGPGYGGNDRRPPRGGGGGWGNGPRDNGPRGPPDTALPPRPPPAQDAPAWRGSGSGGGGGAGWQNQDIPVGRQPRGREPMNDRGPRDGRGPPGGGAGGAGGNRDTYIPSYDPNERAPRYDRRDGRDGREPDRGRRPTGGGAGGGLDYGDGAQRRDDRERGLERGAERNRSRSPGRRPPMDDRNRDGRDRGGYGRR